MKINNEQIEFVVWANKLLQQPNRFPDGNKVIDIYKNVFSEEIAQKKPPYFRSLSPGCMSCIRFCVFTLKNKLVELGIVDNKGNYINNN